MSSALEIAGWVLEQALTVAGAGACGATDLGLLVSLGPCTASRW